MLAATEAQPGRKAETGHMSEVQRNWTTTPESRRGPRGVAVRRRFDRLKAATTGHASPLASPLQSRHHSHEDFQPTSAC